MDKNHLNSLETKDEVIKYAKSLGFTLSARRSLSNLKTDLTIKFNHALSEAISTANSINIRPIEGEQLITVIKVNEVVDVIPISAVEQYCQSVGIPYQSVKTIIGKTWLNVHGYSFKEGT